MTLELFGKPVNNLYIGVSPDEKWLIYSQLDQSSGDLAPVENFR